MYSQFILYCIIVAAAESCLFMAKQPLQIYLSSMSVGLQVHPILNKESVYSLECTVSIAFTHVEVFASGVDMLTWHFEHFYINE